MKVVSRTTLSTVRACALALLVALGGLVLVPQVASAAAKPSCVSVSIRETNPGGWYSKSVARLTNHCGSTQHLKVIWHQGRDSSCLRVLPSRTVSTQAQLTVSHYDRTVTC